MLFIPLGFQVILVYIHIHETIHFSPSYPNHQITLNHTRKRMHTNVCFHSAVICPCFSCSSHLLFLDCRITIHNLPNPRYSSAGFCHLQQLATLRLWGMPATHPPGAYSQPISTSPLYSSCRHEIVELSLSMIRNCSSLLKLGKNDSKGKSCNNLGKFTAVGDSLHLSRIL